MSKKSLLVARRAWRLLRLALLWTRKGGLFRHRLAVSFNLLHKLIRKLVHSNESRRALVYGDHEFSFGDTPVIHVKMHRPCSTLRFKMPHIPCIKPQVDFDDDYDEEDAMSLCIKPNVESDDDYDEEDDVSLDDAVSYSDDVQSTCSFDEEMNEDGDEGIDVRAEEFIAKFYEQIKLQRTMSYVE